MDDALVVLVDGVRLLCEVVRFERDRELVGGFGGSLQGAELGLVHALAEVEGLLIPRRLGFGLGVQPRRLFDVVIAEDVVVEAVLRLPLVLGGLEGVGIKAQGVVGAARVLDVGFVEDVA